MQLVQLFRQPGRMLVIAHRGASAWRPENTMSAFQHAATLGADMLECDVRLSRDHEPVIIHDRTVNRTTAARGRVADFHAHELRQLDAGSWFDSRYADQGIPGLDELLSFASGRIAINLELKPVLYARRHRLKLIHEVAGRLEQHGMVSHVLLSSFDTETVRLCKQYYPRVAAAVLYDVPFYRRNRPDQLFEKTGADALHCSTRSWNRWIQRNRKTGAFTVPVHVYTVNREAEMRRYAQWGLNGLFTDYPDRLRHVLDTWQKEPA